MTYINAAIIIMFIAFSTNIIGGYSITICEFGGPALFSKESKEIAVNIIINNIDELKEHAEKWSTKIAEGNTVNKLLIHVSNYYETKKLVVHNEKERVYSYDLKTKRLTEISDRHAWPIED